MSPRRHWDSTSPSPANECALPPQTKGWEGTLKGGGDPNPTTGEKLSTLPTLCFWESPNPFHSCVMFKCRILFTPLSPFNLWILVTIFKGFERLKCPSTVA